MRSEKARKQNTPEDNFHRQDDIHYKIGHTYPHLRVMGTRTNMIQVAILHSYHHHVGEHMLVDIRHGLVDKPRAQDKLN